MLEESRWRGGGDRIGCGQRLRRDEGEAHRERGMVGELFLARLVQVPAGSDQVTEGAGAEGVVVSVAVTGPADPAVLAVMWLKVPERVGEPVCFG